MIKSITVINFIGESMKLVLSDPWSSGFAVTDISGLGPGGATVNISDYATMNGGRFGSSRVPTRNIVLTLQYLWSNSIEEARHKSYRFFPLGKEVSLVIETDTRVATISGYVESNNPTIFSSDPSTQISILCPDPFFYSQVETTLFYDINPSFEFPFCNDSVTENRLVMSEINVMRERVITYDGDSDVGMTMTIHAVGNAKNIKIYNLSTNETIVLDIDVQPKDDIIICTERGSKYIRRYRDGVTTNIMPLLSQLPCWFKLHQGNNVFSYSAESGYENLELRIDNKVAYEGV